VYIKYVEVQCLTQSIAAENGVSNTFNRVTLCVGLTSCVGLDIVANFQESNVIVVHLLGAFLCFAAGTAYFIFQVSASTALLRIRRTVICVLSFFWVKLARYVSLHHHITVQISSGMLDFAPVWSIEYAGSNRAMNKCMFIHCIWIHSVPSKLKRKSNNEA